MSKIEIGLGSLHINASVIAQGLALEPSRIQAMMRKGEITSVCEHGVNEDAGRYRLTFFHKSRRFRLVVDGTGTVIQRSIVDFRRSTAASVEARIAVAARIVTPRQIGRYVTQCLEPTMTTTSVGSGS